jgi:Berberine and berberine like
MTADLDNFAAGHYVNESDIVADPRRAERSYAKANWERLQGLRRKYDPDGCLPRSRGRTMSILPIRIWDFGASFREIRTD